MTNLNRRIINEVQQLMREPIPGIVVVQDEKNLRHFDCLITGPPDTPYEGGQFKVDIMLPDGYPMDPPIVLFLTKVFHPNISQTGFRKNRICIDILKDKWSPAIQIRSILLSIQLLLGEPNFNAPYEPAVVQQWRRDKTAFIRKAREWTRRYAAPSASSTHTATSTLASSRAAPTTAGMSAVASTTTDSYTSGPTTADPATPAQNTPGSTNVPSTTAPARGSIL